MLVWGPSEVAAAPAPSLEKAFVGLKSLPPSASRWVSMMDWQHNQSYRQRRNHYTEDGESDSQQEPYPPSTPPPPLPKPSSMSSWLSRATSSTQAQFAATAIVSGAVVAGAILGYQHVRRQERVEDLKSSIPELGRNHHAEKVG